VGLLAHPVVAAGAGAIAARIGALRESGVTYAIADAIDDRDLGNLGAACVDLRLATGGAGFGEALAAALGRTSAPSAPPRVAGPAAVIAGSCSQATMAQVERMAATH